MSDPMEDKSLERGRATEKERVRKVTAKFLVTKAHQSTACQECIDSLTTLILKEIKRAERREREACEKVIFEYRQKMCDYILQASKTHRPHFVADCKHDAADSIYKDIRNRRKV